MLRETFCGYNIWYDSRQGKVLKSMYVSGAGSNVLKRFYSLNSARKYIKYLILINREKEVSCLKLGYHYQRYLS